AATFMFWAKWLGKLSGIAAQPKNDEITVHRSEWISIGLMAALVIFCCIAIPFISWIIVEPYILSVYPAFVSGISTDNLWIASIATVFICIVLFAGLGKSKARKVDVYLSGVSADNDARTFRNSLSQESTATARNWYMESIFGEKLIAPVGTIACTIIIIAAFAVAAVGLPGLM
ncbi:MAG: NADH-quinone oxidoreductase subunit L, partial [Raoultibacter sp.]